MTVRDSPRTSQNKHIKQHNNVQPSDLPSSRAWRRPSASVGRVRPCDRVASPRDQLVLP